LARKTGAIVSVSNATHVADESNADICTQIIPTIALAPSDIVAYFVAKGISEQLESKGTAEVESTAVLELQGMSSGSLNTVLPLMSTYRISWIFPGNLWSLTQRPKLLNIVLTFIQFHILGTGSFLDSVSAQPSSSLSAPNLLRTEAPSS